MYEKRKSLSPTIEYKHVPVQMPNYGMKKTALDLRVAVFNFEYEWLKQ